jgi:hypothetical protein
MPYKTISLFSSLVYGISDICRCGVWSAMPARTRCACCGGEGKQEWEVMGDDQADRASVCACHCILGNKWVIWHKHVGTLCCLRCELFRVKLNAVLSWSHLPALWSSSASLE